MVHDGDPGLAGGHPAQQTGLRLMGVDHVERPLTHQGQQLAVGPDVGRGLHRPDQVRHPHQLEGLHVGDGLQVLDRGGVRVTPDHHHVLGRHGADHVVDAPLRPATRQPGGHVEHSSCHVQPPRPVMVTAPSGPGARHDELPDLALDRAAEHGATPPAGPAEIASPVGVCIEPISKLAR